MKIQRSTHENSGISTVTLQLPHYLLQLNIASIDRLHLGKSSSNLSNLPNFIIPKYCQPINHSPHFSPVPPLNPPDSIHLEAAQGWLELGNHEEAFEELERIDAPLRAHPDVLEVRWDIYAEVENWGELLLSKIFVFTRTHLLGGR